MRSMLRDRRIVVAALALAMAHSALGQDISKPVTTVAVPLDGTAVSLPAVAAGVAARLRVTGVFTCSIDGKTYDALFRTDSSGGFTQPHGLLVIEPSGSTLVEQDTGQHSYLFQPPAGALNGPTGFTARLDTNQLIHEFIQPPSDVRSSLSGNLRVTLLVAPPAHAIPTAVVMLVVPLLLLGIFAAVAVHNHRRAASLAFADVVTQRARIRDKCETAMAEIGPGDGLFGELRERVKALREGAEEVAGHVILFRKTRARFDAEGVRREIETMGRRAEAAGDEQLRRRYEQEIAGKRQTLQFLQANEDREAEYLLRLAGVETALDNLRLKLPELRVTLAATDADRAAVAEMDSELALLHKTVAETREQLPAGAAAGIL